MCENVRIRVSELQEPKPVSEDSRLYLLAARCKHATRLSECRNKVLRVRMACTSRRESMRQPDTRINYKSAAEKCRTARGRQVALQGRGETCLAGSLSPASRQRLHTRLYRHTYTRGFSCVSISIYTYVYIYRAAWH